MLRPLFFSLDHVVDQEGRPLREHRAPAELLKGVPMDLAQCQYPGSRHQHPNPMNVSALRQMNAHWEDAIACLQYLNSLCRRPHGHVRYVDLWRIANFAAILPTYLTYRGRAPIDDGTLPPYVAAAYKIVIGVNDALLNLMSGNLLAKPEQFDDPVDLDELQSFIEAKNVLIGAHQVCAGPEPLIRKALGAMLAASAHRERSTGTVSLIQDESRFLDFSYSLMNSRVLAGLHGVLSGSVYVAIRDHLIQQFDISVEVAPSVSANPLTKAGPETLAIVAARVVDRAVARDCTHGGELHDAALGMTRLWERGRLEGLEKQLRELVGEKLGTETNLRCIATYLLLERASSKVSAILKRQCLEALELESHRLLALAAAPFSPPNDRMRGLLNTVFGVDVHDGVAARGTRRIAFANEA